MKLPALISKRSAATRSSADIDAEIEALDLRINQAQALVAALQAERDDVVREGDIDALAAHDTRAQRAALESEILAAKRADLVKQRADAAIDEDRAARRTAYDRGRRASEKARILITTEYARVARELAEVLGRLEALKGEVRVANSALPAGEVAIPDPEDAVRGRPARAGRSVVRRTPVRVDRRTGRELVTYHLDDPNVVVEYREHVEHEPATPAQAAVPLSQLIRLPAAAHGEDTIYPASASSAAITHLNFGRSAR
jgi:hypothetical protein